MLFKQHGGSALHVILIVLFLIGLASADEEQIQLAQPDFAIYHTKYASYTLTLLSDLLLICPCWLTNHSVNLPPCPI